MPGALPRLSRLRMSRIALGEIAKRFLFLADLRVLMNGLKIFSIRDIGWSLYRIPILLSLISATGQSFVSRILADLTLSLLADIWAERCILGGLDCWSDGLRLDTLLLAL